MHTRGNLLQSMILVQKKEALACLHVWDINKLHSLLLQNHKSQNLKKIDLVLRLKRKYQRVDQTKHHSSCSTLFHPTLIYLSNVQFSIEHLPAIVRKFN